MFYNISYDVLYVNTICKLWLDVPKRLKINGLITPDSHEFPRLIHSLFRDTSQTPGGLKRARYRSNHGQPGSYARPRVCNRTNEISLTPQKSACVY
jgi:hypothetical protein